MPKRYGPSSAWFNSMQILPTSAKSSIQPTPEIQVKPPTTQAFEAPPFPNTTADGRPPSTKPPATSLPS